MPDLLTTARARLRAAAALARRLLAVPDQLDRLENITVGADRELLETLASSIPAIGAGVDAVLTDRDQWRTRALAAEGAAATDEADDLAAAQPLRDALAALADKVAVAAPPGPAPELEALPGVISAAPDPDPSITPLTDVPADVPAATADPATDTPVGTPPSDPAVDTVTTDDRL